MIDEKKLIEDIEKSLKRMIADEDGLHPVSLERVVDVLKEQPKVGEWIPVSERLPETDENRKYLVCGEKGGIYIAEFVCNTIHRTPLGTSWWTAHGRYCPKPIAWMPLPEPYKE